MIKLYPTLGEAYRLKVLFNDLWEMPDKPAAEAFLRQWCDEVDASQDSSVYEVRQYGSSTLVGDCSFR